ncbi:MAG: PAS domain-containing protein [Deltaproteobacteria bacterium]|nr:PAS domain-containing protein [Deltaproteobacteria bacterium]
MRSFVNLLLVAGALYVALAGFALARSRSAVSRFYALTNLLAAVWAITYYFELTSARLDDKILWLQVKLVFIVFIPPAWLAMVCAFVGRGRWLRRWIWGLVLLVPLLTVPVALTTRHHDLFRHHFAIDHSLGIGVLVYQWGPWARGVAAVSHLLGAGSLVVLVWGWRGASPVRRRQLGAMFLAYLIPGLIDASFVLGLSPIPGLNLSMFSLLVTSWLWVWVIFGYATFDLVPLARGVLLDSLPSMVVVVDDAGRLADLNEAAAARLGVSPRRALGRKVTDVVPAAWRPHFAPPAEAAGPRAAEPVAIDDGESTTWYERVATPIRDGERSLGTLFYLRDVTDRVRAERAAREIERLREERRLLQQQALLLRDLHDGIGGITANIGLLAALGEKAGTVEAKDGILARIARLAAEGGAEVDTPAFLSRG